jgi:hypothetical protein
MLAKASARVHLHETRAASCPPLRPCATAGLARHGLQRAEAFAPATGAHSLYKSSVALGVARPARSGARSSVMASASSQDLLIVGPGVLGSYLGKLWKEQHPGATVTGQTNSTANHERWDMRRARCPKENHPCPQRKP